MRRALFNLGLRGEAVNDLVQDAFERLYKQLLSSGEPNSPPQWLKTVALNLGRNYLTNSANKNHHPFMDEWNSSLEDEIQLTDSLPEKDLEVRSVPDNFSDRNLSIDCVKQKLKDFRARYPNRFFAISLFKDGYSIGEIAQALERTEVATRKFLSECRKSLVPYLEECWN